MNQPRLTVVVPAYNESTGLLAFHGRLQPVLTTLEERGIRTAVVYVDDGSRDDTYDVMSQIADEDDRVTLLKLSRNFGKELALTAGLDAISIGAAMVIDADLQDPPELIPEFVDAWLEGFDVVYGTRLERDGETPFKKATASAFYRLISRLSNTPIPKDTGDFRLLSPRALKALKELRERHRFMKGLFTWVGYRTHQIQYRREARHEGTSKFNYWKLWNFALEGITSFSTFPLRMATYVGLLTAALAFVYGAYIIVKAVAWGDPVAGYPSMMAVILFLGGVQLIALGIIGEYLGRLFIEAKQRPLYLLEDVREGAPHRVATLPVTKASIKAEKAKAKAEARAASAENEGDPKAD